MAAPTSFVDLGVADGALRILTDSKSGMIVLKSCSTEGMVAENLTKVVGMNKFAWCRESIGEMRD